MDKYILKASLSIFNRCNIDEFKNTTILITGANGLIGGFLADFFHYLNMEHSYNIKLMLSSLSESPSRLNHLLEEPNVRYISKDLSNNSEWKDIENCKIDYCFYCAGYAQPAKFLSDPLKTFFLNTSGVHNTFKAVFKENKYARCIFLSSSEIYTSNENIDSHKESDNINIDLTHKRYSYILGKIGGETVVNSFRDIGFDTAVVRVSLCYGPGISSGDTRVLSELVAKGIDNKTIDLFDDGAAKRKYMHISDFCIMLFNITLMGYQSVYNVGGKEETTIYDIAQFIGNRFKKNVVKGKTNIISKSAPKIVWVSLDRYEQEFGKFNFLPLKNGLTQFIDWFEIKQKE